MPLSEDQYNVRRSYRDAKLQLNTVQAGRNPETGASTGKVLTKLGKPTNFDEASITSQDVAQYGDMIQRVTKKVKIAYAKYMYELDWSSIVVSIGKTNYNVVQNDVRRRRDMYLYLTAVTSKGVSDNG